MEPARVPTKVVPLFPKPAGDDPGEARSGEAATRWTMIVRAQGSGPEAHKALGELLHRYERTVLAMLRCCRRPWNLTAEDLKQDFFLGIVRRNDVRKLDRGRGRFRDFLRVAVGNFMKNVWKAWLAERRGNRLTTTQAFQMLHGITPEVELMREFAEDTLLHALARHREQSTDKPCFDRLMQFLPGPQLDQTELAPIAAALGMQRNCLAVKIYQMREKHKRVLREVVAETLDVDPTDPDGARAIALEMALLYRALCDAPPGHAVPEEV